MIGLADRYHKPEVSTPRLAHLRADVTAARYRAIRSVDIAGYLQQIDQNVRDARQ
jgi:hypothetical protein